MRLLDPLYKSEAMRGVFSDRRRLQCMLDFEAALARSEARLSVIPRAAAEIIAGRCRAELFPLAPLAEAAARDGNLAIPMVKRLTALVRESDPQAAGYVHWGTTSQDAIDTGLVLQLREAFTLLEADLDRLCGGLAQLAESYRAAPMPGRTWLQHAVPVTFGLKAAGWLDAMLRHKERLAALKPRALVVEFGGAAGTLASLGAAGMAVSAALAEELQLRLPALPWHAHRDRLAEVAAWLGLLTGTLGKMARDLSLQMQTEVDEVSAPAGGGSSTMPQKQNPVAAAVALSAAIRVPGLVATMLTAMVEEHERGLGGWHAEWEVLPEICMLAAGALERMAATVSGLRVHPKTMRGNLEITRGLVMAEAVSTALAEKIGRGQAHALVASASRRSVEEKRHLRAVLEEDPQVIEHFGAQQLERLFDPLLYTGAAQQMIDRVLAEHRLAAKPAPGSSKEAMKKPIKRESKVSESRPGAPPQKQAHHRRGTRRDAIPRTPIR